MNIVLTTYVFIMFTNHPDVNKKRKMPLPIFFSVILNTKTVRLIIFFFIIVVHRLIFLWDLSHFYFILRKSREFINTNFFLEL